MALDAPGWRLRAGWKRGAQALDALLGALPTGVVLLGMGCLALTVSNRLPVWLAIPARVTQARLATWGLAPAPSATGGAPGGVVALATLLALLAAYACFIAAMWASPPRWLLRVARWLAIPVLLWSLFASLQTAAILGRGLVTSVTQWPPRYTSDEMYYNHYSALLTLEGVNPYTDADIHLAAAMNTYQIRGFTPIARGRFSDPRHVPTGAEMRAVAQEYRSHPQSPPPELDPRTFHSYPAGAFLVDIPSVWAGLPSVGFAQILLFIAFSVALLACAPPGTRLALGVVIWANPTFAQRVVTGDFDIWWLVALIAAWMLSERRWLSGVLVGVACAVKQTAWFAAPFYFLWIWSERGLREALRRTAIAVASFLIINAPWILLSPRAWMESLLLPVSLPLLPDGSGLIALGLAGATPLAPSRVYTLLELAAWVGALTWAWRMRVRAPFVGLVLPLASLLLAWRSPERYFLALSVLAAAALLFSWRRAGEREREQTAHPRAVASPVRPLTFRRQRLSPDG